MNYCDQQLTCTVCGKTLIFTVTEQRKLYEAGQEIIPPTRCKSCRSVDPETGRCSGQVKWFSLEKGYGFIVKPDQDEVFFHRSQLVDAPPASLEEGTSVTFEQVSTQRGLEAREVKLETI